MSNENPWGDEVKGPVSLNDLITEKPKSKKTKEVHVESDYDIEGLMTDFPTANLLERFVYDETGVVLNLKGRANQLKYKIALDVLNGVDIDTKYIGDENPYIDKNDIVPEEPLKQLPPQPAEVYGHIPVTQFQCDTFPHPDPEWRAQDQKCQVVFRKYTSGLITYEVLGPIGKKAVGTRINKFGQPQPEKIVWIDPRTGEQVIRDNNGKLTPLGTRLQAFMKKQKVNKSNQWDTWIDRDFVAANNMILDNPWSV